jgi:hypothetical protein
MEEVVASSQIVIQLPFALLQPAPLSCSFDSVLECPMTSWALLKTGSLADAAAHTTLRRTRALAGVRKARGCIIDPIHGQQAAGSSSKQRLRRPRGARAALSAQAVVPLVPHLPRAQARSQTGWGRGDACAAPQQIESTPAANAAAPAAMDTHTRPMPETPAAASPSPSPAAAAAAPKSAVRAVTWQQQAAAAREAGSMHHGDSFGVYMEHKNLKLRGEGGVAICLTALRRASSAVQLRADVSQPPPTHPYPLPATNPAFHPPRAV